MGRRWFRLGFAASLCGALWVALGAVEDQSRRVLDLNGNAWPFNAVVGPTSGFDGRERLGWQILVSADRYDPTTFDRLNRLIAIHVGIDLAFLLVLLATMIIISRMWRKPVMRTTLLVLAIVAAVADVGEDLMIIGRTDALSVLIGFTLVKWIAHAVFAIVLIVALLVGQRPGIAACWSALALHRMSFAPTVALFLLSVLSGSAVLEQLPDAQRRWLDASGIGYAVAALLAVIVFAAATAVTTRVRYAWAESRRQPAEKTAPPATLSWWTLGPGIVLGCAIIAGTIGQVPIQWFGQDVPGAIAVARTAAFVLAPLLIVIGLSTIIRWRVDQGKMRLDDTMPEFTAYQVRAMFIAGRGAVAAIWVVVGLGLIRAFTPILLVFPDIAGLNVWGAAGFLLIGGLAVIGPWLRLIKTSSSDSPAWATKQPKGVRIGVLTVLSWMALFLGLGIFPSFAAVIGLAATAILAIAALAGMLGGLGMIVQDRMPAEIFRALGLRRTPLITTMVITVVLVTMLSGTGTIHYVDFGKAVTTAQSADTRPDFQRAFDDWVTASTKACPVGDAKTRVVRPVVMVAAEGGGIRASYWTVRALEEMGRDLPCAAASTLFSAGASGGSVGLTVARFSREGSAGEPAAQRAVAAVTQMAEPGVLSETADGFMVRDIFYGATGVPLPQGLDRSWADRARLLEQGWKKPLPGESADVAWGTRSFVSETTKSSSPGALIINTSSAKNTCRAWLSEINLAAAAGTLTSAESTDDPERSCDSTPGPGPRTIDVLASYGPYGSTAGDTAWDRCLGDVSAATAALLTARFPYVTPGGVMGPCPDRGSITGPTQPYWPRTQFVDGGYLENTGLATITDLAPLWLSTIKAHNSVATTKTTEPYLVPIIVYLSNGDQQISQPRVNQGPTSEITLPISTIIKGGASRSGADALLPRAQALVAVDQFCPLTDGKVVPDCAAAGNRFAARVVVVDRSTRPEIAPPLGWTFSHASQLSLDAAMVEQVQTYCRKDSEPTDNVDAQTLSNARDRNPNCRLGYGALGDFRSYFG